MTPIDDLDAPLGQKPEKSISPPTGPRTGLIALALLLIIGAGGGAYYFTSFNLPVEEQAKIEIDAAVKPAEKVVATATIEKPDPIDIDPELGELTELEPDGDITEPIIALTELSSNQPASEIRQKTGISPSSR